MCVLVDYYTFFVSSHRLVLNYSEGVAMLRANGVEMGDEDDLT